MNTPIYNYVKEYSERGTSRLHMPGHKGIVRLGPEPMDITEIGGADELYFPEGIILESEENAAALFGSGITAYSVEGSSHGIRSMIILARAKAGRPADAGCGNSASPVDPSSVFSASPFARPYILAARNAHKAFLYACAVTDTDVRWLYPEEDAENSVSACRISAETLERTLSEAAAAQDLPFAVFITSPDYLGHLADVRRFSEICHAYGVLLLVDNAHGAYLHFLETPLHPMDLGADMCSDSAHKTLPVLTGGAYLHVRSGYATRGEVKAAMEVTGTTSPSYLIMASLDLCNRYLADEFRESLKKTVTRVAALKNALKALDVPYTDSEPLKLVVNAGKLGMSGSGLGELLEAYQVIPEFCDAEFLVLMFTPDNTEEDFAQIEEALKAAKMTIQAGCVSEADSEALPDGKTFGITSGAAPSLRLRPLEKVLSIREAVFSLHETVPVENAIGRVLGAPAVSCPPAVPIAVSGERITEELIPVFEAYGIRTISIVKGEFS